MIPLELPFSGAMVRSDGGSFDTGGHGRAELKSWAELPIMEPMIASDDDSFGADGHG